MAKKEKKVYKQNLVLAPKISLNRKWTVWRQLETKNRQANVRDEIKKIVLDSLQKSLPQNKQSNNIKQYEFILNFKHWNQDVRSSKSRTKNYCHYVGRSRSVNRKMFMARHMFRKFARFGMLPGFIKERC